MGEPLPVCYLNGELLPLREARKQPPPLPAVYDLAGETLIRGAVKPIRDDAVMLIEGAQLFPLRLKLVYHAAIIAAEIEELQSAHALAAHGIKYAPEGPGRKRFEDLKAQLPPDPTPPPPPPPEPKVPAAPAKKR